MIFFKIETINKKYFFTRLDYLFAFLLGALALAVVFLAAGFAFLASCTSSSSVALFLSIWTLKWQVVHTMLRCLHIQKLSRGI